MGSIADPVAAGIVANLVGLGGNVTGFASQSLELETKRLEIMRDLLPEHHADRDARQYAQRLHGPGNRQSRAGGSRGRPAF